MPSVDSNTLTVEAPATDLGWGVVVVVIALTKRKKETFSKSIRFGTSLRYLRWWWFQVTVLFISIDLLNKSA
jgi:hypothetical protein